MHDYPYSRAVLHGYSAMDSTAYLLKERQKMIRDRLARHGRVMAGNLAAEFEVSEDTIRRDLRELAAAGFCQRVYGGALAPDRPMSERLTQAPERKAALAAAAAPLIEPHMTVFFDAGSTNLAIAQTLPTGMKLTAATNAPVIAAALVGRSDIEVIMIGGHIDDTVGGAIDAKAMRDAEMLRPDLLVLGTCGLDLASGITSTRFDDAAFKRCVAERSRSVLAAVTTEKIGVPAPYAVVPVARCSHIVVEHDCEARDAAAIAAEGPSLVRALAPGKP